MKNLLLIVLVLVIGNVSYAGLVSQWDFDENSGDTIYDAKGSHDGTVYGAAWDDGKFGSSLSFYYNYAVVGEYPTLQNFSQITISAWVYYTGSPKLAENYDFLVGKELEYKIDIDGSNIRFLTSNDWEGSVLTSDTALENNQWYHIAAVYDGSEKRIYINGQQDQNTVTTSGSLNVRHHPFTMGAQPNDTGYEDYYRGKLDEVRIYDNALTQSQIQALMVPEPCTLMFLATCGLAFYKRNSK